VLCGACDSCLTMAIETGRRNCVLLDGQFTLDCKSKTLYSVAVDRSGISYTPLSCSALRRTGFLRRGVSWTEETRRLSFSDIVGCDCQRGVSDEDVSVYCVIYAYPRRQSSESDFAACRTRVNVSLRFDKRTTYDENFQDASLWRNVISCLMRKIDIEPIIGKSSSSGLFLLDVIVCKPNGWLLMHSICGLGFVWSGSVTIDGKASMTVSGPTDRLRFSRVCRVRF